MLLRPIVEPYMRAHVAVGLAKPKRVVSLANPRGLANFSSTHGRE